MSLDLSRLLDRAVPEPEHVLDGAQVLAAARRRRALRARTGVVVALIVGAAGGALAVRGLAPADRESAVASGRAPSIAALDQRERLAQRPDSFSSPFTSLELRHPGEASRLGSVDSWDVWLADTVDDGLCLVVVDVGRSGSTCQPVSNLTTAGLWMIHHEEGRRPRLLLVAPDGYTTARLGTASSRVGSNLAVLPVDGPDSTATLSGRGLPDLTFDLSGSLPPARVRGP
jgi:hypothetical protein